VPNPLPQLPLATYRFHYTVLDDLVLTEDPRGLWHGVFGRSLRETACVVPGTDCGACLLLHQCGYSHLYSGPRPPDAELMRRYDNIPVPHVFRIGLDHPDRLPPGQALVLEMLLVGNANDRLALVVHAMAAAGRHGLGARRSRLQLQQVEQQLPDVPVPRALLEDGRLPALPAPAAPLLPPAPAGPVTLCFHSPYKPSGKAAHPAGLDIGPFIMAVVRRISLLQYFYTGRRLDADFKALKAASTEVRVLDHALRRHRSGRWAARRGTRVDTSGLVGSLTLAPAGLEPLWPYLHLGQWLNVGKNASMGFGQYRLDAL
jgi:hypothetical protein